MDSLHPGSVQHFLTTAPLVWKSLCMVKRWTLQQTIWFCFCDQSGAALHRQGADVAPNVLPCMRWSRPSLDALGRATDISADSDTLERNAGIRTDSGVEWSHTFHEVPVCALTIRNCLFTGVVLDVGTLEIPAPSECGGSSAWVPVHVRSSIRWHGFGPTRAIWSFWSVAAVALAQIEADSLGDGNALFFLLLVRFSLKFLFPLIVGALFVLCVVGAATVQRTSTRYVALAVYLAADVMDFTVAPGFSPLRGMAMAGLRRSAVSLTWDSPESLRLVRVGETPRSSGTAFSGCRLTGRDEGRAAALELSSSQKAVVVRLPLGWRLRDGVRCLLGHEHFPGSRVLQVRGSGVVFTTSWIHVQASMVRFQRPWPFGFEGKWWWSWALACAAVSPETRQKRRFVWVAETLLNSARLFLLVELPFVVVSSSWRGHGHWHAGPVQTVTNDAGLLCSIVPPGEVSVFATLALVGWCTCSTGRSTASVGTPLLSRYPPWVARYFFNLKFATGFAVRRGQRRALVMRSQNLTKVSTVSRVLKWDLSEHLNVDSKSPSWSTTIPQGGNNTRVPDPRESGCVQGRECLFHGIRL